MPLILDPAVHCSGTGCHRWIGFPSVCLSVCRSAPEVPCREPAAAVGGHPEHSQLADDWEPREHEAGRAPRREPARHRDQLYGARRSATAHDLEPHLHWQAGPGEASSCHRMPISAQQSAWNMIW
jgi:hypothetical protein